MNSAMEAAAISYETKLASEIDELRRQLAAANEREKNLEGALRVFAHAYETDNRPAQWVIELGNELLAKWRNRNRDE